MKTCKFCGITEATTHINRDNMCARCYRITERAKKNLLTQEEQAWFDEMCRFNFKYGMFVPLAQRRELRAAAQWSCKCCGTKDTTRRDDSYKSYCTDCAYAIRSERALPEVRKPRKDKGVKRCIRKAHK